MSKINQFITWCLPIRKAEWKQFFLVFIIFFLLGFCYNLLRPIKSSIVMSASDAGSEIIPFLKVWGIIPGAFLFAYLNSLLSKYYDRNRIFNIMTSIFIIFFIIFLFILFPNSETIALHKTADSLSEILPLRLIGLISMLRYWHLSLFYIFSEMWATVLMTMLFWGFINEVSTSNQATRTYALFNLGGNVGSIFSGLVGMHFSTLDYKTDQFFYGHSAWEQTIALIVSIVIISGFLIYFLFYLLTKENKPIVSKRTEDSLLATDKGTNKKVAFTLKESFRELSRSKYLRSLCIIVIGYNLAFNLVDFMWLEHLTQLFPNDSLGISSYLYKVTLFKGIISTFLSIFVTHRLINFCGWRFTALITPFVILITSLMFFPLILAKDSEFVGSFCEILGTTPLALAVFIGACQQSLTRAAKYSIYDSTKELAFLPLSTEMKRRSKAVIDGVASRLGKSSSSLLYQVLFQFITVVEAIPYILILCIAVLSTWIKSIFILNKKISNQK